MEYKVVDNTVLSKKESINKIDNKLDKEKSRARKLENLRETSYSIHKDMEKCFALLSKSIKGPRTDSNINDMYETNSKLFNEINQNINKELKGIKKRVNELYTEKENIIKNKK